MGYATYMMASKNNVHLYIGVTNSLQRRVREHKSKKVDGYTARYNCVKLVWYEEFLNIADAIAREKQLKNWHRLWKNELVEKVNPEWRDLSLDWTASDGGSASDAFSFLK